MNINKNFIGSNNPDQYYCLDFSAFPAYLGGDWTKDILGYLNFEVLFCPDDKNYFKNNCTNLEKLNTILNNDSNMLFFSVIYPRAYITHTDLISPLKFQPENYLNSINLHIQKEDSLFLNKNLYNDDQGWMFTDSKEYSLISGEELDKKINFDTYRDLISAKTNSLYTFNIYFKNNVIIHYRNFMKIQDLSAKVVGFIKIIFIFFNFLNKIPNSHMRDNIIINEFFEIGNREE